MLYFSLVNPNFIPRASYVEIYNENCIDLLEKKDEKNQVEKIEIQKKGLNITPIKAVVCQNAQTVKIILIYLQYCIIVMLFDRFLFYTQLGYGSYQNW